MGSLAGAVQDQLSTRWRLLKVYAVFTFPFACVPFLYFYFREHGITLGEYGRMIAFYYLAMVLAEIPTGLLADRYGKRIALVLGPIILAAGFLVLFGLRTFTAFCVGHAVLGIGHAVLSGAPSALLFEVLQGEGRGHEYLRRESTLHALRLLGTGLAFLLGGLVVALWGFSVSLPVTAALCLVAAGAALGLSAAGPAMASAHPLLRSATTDVARPEVRWILVYFVLLFCLLRYGFHNYQPYLEAVALDDPIVIAALFCSLNLVAAPCSLLAPTLAEQIGPRAVFWAMPLLMVGSFWLMAGFLERAAVVMFFLQQLPFGLHWALVQDFVNHRIRAAARATVLSILSFSGRLAFVPLSAVLFAMQDEIGITRAYTLVGLAGGLATIGCMAWGHRLLSGRS